MCSRPLFKRRPKIFSGTRRWSAIRPQSPEEAAPATERPVPLETASGKKLAISSCSSDAASTGESSKASSVLTGEHGTKGYRLVSCERLCDAVTKIGVCSTCGYPLALKEDLATRRGIVSRLAISCTNSVCDTETLISDPYASDAKSLNSRSIMAMRAIGRGQSSLESFFGLMDMLPPVTSSSYVQHMNTLAQCSMTVASENMLAASAHLHKLHDIAPTELLDIAVTCDGTWSKRGFTAIHGIVVVIAWETGQVLDFEIKTKRCNVCTRHKARLATDSEEFEEWWENHQAFCDLNHNGSSPAMECAAATDIFMRSKNLCLRYTEVISDGDSKTIKHLNDVKPYGDEVLITKHECVGHVQKRVGTRLRAVKSVINRDKKVARSKVNELKENLKDAKKKAKEKGKGKSNGKGKGKAPKTKEVEELETRLAEAEADVIKDTINDKTIDLLQVYYGNAIRAHTNDLEGMKTACWAVFYHSISTDEKPQHHCCPVGAESWCKYQRSLALGQDAPPHTPRIPTSFEQYIKPIFDDLCKPELLEKCLLGATQNRNESFNSLIWVRAPKTEYVTRPTIEVAVSQAVLVFNSGKQALLPILERLGIEPGPLCCDHLATKDSARIKKSQYRETELAKQRRKSKRAVEMDVEETHIAEEGTTYGAGQF